MNALELWRVSPGGKRTCWAPFRAARSPPMRKPQPIGTLPRVLVGNTPQDAVFDPATDTVYVANQGGKGPSGSVNTLSVVDARTCNARDTSGCGQTPPTVAAGNGPFGIAIDDATHTIYVADSTDDGLGDQRRDLQRRRHRRVRADSGHAGRPRERPASWWTPRPTPCTSETEAATRSR